ncbi:hypothetical protein SELMODRAFT_72165, partial [Selaginella moellendorffii]
SCMISCYTDNGRLDGAKLMFDTMPAPRLISWTTMLSAYATGGRAREALQLFSSMILHGLECKEVSFVTVLNACSHMGWVETGREYFLSMVSDHGIHPVPDHYTCLVDAFGRAGQLNRARDLLLSVPFMPDCAAWGALLGASMAYDDVQVGELAAEQLMELEPDQATTYVKLANAYA